MGIVAQRSRSLGNTFPSRSFRSFQPWPSGNQIQSAQTSWLSSDSILKDENRQQEWCARASFVSGQRKLRGTEGKVLSILWSSFTFWHLINSHNDSVLTRSFQGRGEQKRLIGMSIDWPAATGTMCGYFLFWNKANDKGRTLLCYTSSLFLYKTSENTLQWRWHWKIWNHLDSDTVLSFCLCTPS